jgi:hypothetical protein
MRHPILLASLCLALVMPAPMVFSQGTEPPASPAEAATETAPESVEKQSEEQAAEISRAQNQEQALHRRLPTAQLRQLESGDDAFLGLFLPAAKPQPRGGVLLIADRNEHADWPELIGPARRYLSSQGWHTLAITLPETPRFDPTLDEAARAEVLDLTAERTTQRINIAARALQSEGAKTLVLLGRGEAAFWALHATASDTTARTEASALILMQSRGPAYAKEPQAKLDDLMAQWQKPAYAIFDGTDQISRERARHQRLNAQRLANAHYEQLVLIRQDKSELGQQMLAKRLQGWLEKNLPPQQP